MHNKIHRCNIIIVDNNAIKRLKLGLFFLLRDNLNFRYYLYVHLYIRIFFYFWIYFLSAVKLRKEPGCFGSATAERTQELDYHNSLSVLNSSSVSSIFVTSKFSRMCCGLSDIGMVMTRVWAIS